MGNFVNSDPFEPWNDSFSKDDPFAPWNDTMLRDDPFAPWNDLLGHYGDREQKKYNYIP
jgi:hypothetical protein